VLKPGEGSCDGRPFDDVEGVLKPIQEGLGLLVPILKCDPQVLDKTVSILAIVLGGCALIIVIKDPERIHRIKF
jgi:hypothetical protein